MSIIYINISEGYLEKPHDGGGSSHQSRNKHICSQSCGEYYK